MCSGTLGTRPDGKADVAGTLALMPRVFRHRLRVRYGECDPQGVVFNANYLAYFDVILTEFWREAIGDYTAMIADHDADMVVAESRIGFRSPAAFDDELDFELRVARLGTTALTCHIDARVGDRLVVEGEMRHVFIEPATKRKRAIPDAIRAGLEPFLAPELEPASG
jgi:acyl-CoA thioester hydrolase